MIVLDKSINETDELVYWERYVKTKNKIEKEKIKVFFVIKYAPLVKYVAGKMAIKMPNNIDFEDLVSFGTLGLLDAIEKFDYRKKIKFKTYGITRIRGSIYDELRNLDWVPRSIRQKNKEIDCAVKKIEDQTGKRATKEEISEETGMSVNDINKLENMKRDVTIFSLDDVVKWGDNNEDINLLDNIKAPDSMNPYNQMERTEVRKTISESIKELPEKEKQVLILYYYEDLTLKEIGAVLEVTESRVSQLHSKAINSLRNSLYEIKKSLV